MENKKGPAIYCIPAELEGVKTRKGDKSLVITIGTKELSSIQKAGIMDMQDRNIFFFMSEAELSTEGVLGVMPEPKQPGEKWSRSQRLRFAIMSLHTASGGKPEDAEDFYSGKMDEIIQHYNKKVQDIKNKM